MPWVPTTTEVTTTTTEAKTKTKPTTETTQCNVYYSYNYCLRYFITFSEQYSVLLLRYGNAFSELILLKVHIMI